MSETPPSVGELFAGALARCGNGSRLDLELLLCEVLKLSRAGLLIERSSAVTPAAAARFASLLAAYRDGRPVAQLLGRREFWSLELEVNEHVLVPRPDTETLVEVVLELLPRAPAGALADLGTGSGAIALALASENTGRFIVALDASVAALAVAQANRRRHRLDSVALLAGRWLDAIAPGSCAIIASNPPYIEEDDPCLAVDGALRFEPRQALAGGPEGLDDLRALVAAAPARLLPDGWLALEHGASQGAAVRQLLQAAGFADIDTRRDLAGHERVSRGRWPGDLLPSDASPILT